MVQPLTLQVQRPLVSVVSVCWLGNLPGAGGGVRFKRNVPTPGLTQTSLHVFSSDGIRCLLGLRTTVVTFRPFHGVSSKVLTVLIFWWLGKAQLKVKEVVAPSLSICRSVNIKIPLRRLYKVFTLSHS